MWGNGNSVLTWKKIPPKGEKNTVFPLPDHEMPSKVVMQKRKG
jgi:hypothetical protein